MSEEHLNGPVPTRPDGTIDWRATLQELIRRDLQEERETQREIDEELSKEEKMDNLITKLSYGKGDRK